MRRRNDGVRNSGVRNDGARNSGVRNSGVRNSGVRNGGVRNRNNGARNNGVRNNGERNNGAGNNGIRNNGTRLRFNAATTPPPMLDPPHRPLSPARLASLANALGVPAPALRTPFRRSSPLLPALRPPASPVPSSPASPSSRFLMHVIPPLHLPHDDPRFTPPPAAAAGYHTHYRRGILVPVTHAFNALLAAIAKEYALPSTVGIVLYLVADERPEPGPCLSEDTWTHIWTRVVRADSTQSRRGSPSEDASASRHPRPLLSAAAKPQSVSSTSSTPDLQPNSTSPSLASSADPDTPDSLEGPDAFPLPGLNSTSLVPVLAKVEFDIDRKKAHWYEPWLRSRRLNQAKREDEQSDGKRPPLALLTGVKGATVPQVNGSDLEAISNVVDDDATSKSFPPPLGLDPRLAIPYEESCVPGSTDSVHLAYLGEPSSPNKTGGSDEELDCYTPHRRPEESEKRVGAIFEALDLGLDMSVDFDEDRRRSQLLMKAKLDEIERAMMQLSPRALKDTVEEDLTHFPSRSAARVGDAHSKDLHNISQAWPAVPYAALKESMNSVEVDGPLSPPRLAVNGVTTSTPFVPSASLEQSLETQRRREELEEEYPELVVKTEENVMSDSPIPLSPDPFSRYPTEMPPILDLGAHLANGDQNDAGRGETVCSRFSIDSADDVIAKPMNRTTLMSMKSIKNLWRRSDKSNGSGRISPSERPSQEDSSLPPVPDIVPSPRSPVPGSSASGRLSVEQLSASSLTVPTSPTFVHPSSKLAGLHFDQESPYPSRFSPSARYSPSSTSPSLPAQATPEPEKSRKSILKWRSKPRGESISQNGAGEPGASVNQPRTSSSGRRPSMGSLILRDAPMTFSEIPPSPRIPEHFQNHLRQGPPVASVAMGGKTEHSSADSQTAFDHPAGSPVRIISPTRCSTGSSHETYPSFDTSQFEMVSPKTAALSYPYHALDYE